MYLFTQGYINSVGESTTPPILSRIVVYNCFAPMAYQLSTFSVADEDSSIQILGETGGTIVHVFPNGEAQVKKGTKKNVSSQRHQSVQNQERTTNTLNTTNVLKQKGDVKPPPPPTLRPGCIAFESATLEPSTPPKGEPAKRQPAAVEPALVARPTNLTVEKKPKTRKELERYLLDQKLVSPVQLDVARYDMSMSSMSLEDILVARGWVPADIIDQFQNS